MLPRFLSILLVIGVQAVFVVGLDFGAPEMLAAKDPNTILQPLSGRPTDADAEKATDGSKVIRGLLGVRQDSCPTHYSACSDGG